MGLTLDGGGDMLIVKFVPRGINPVAEAEVAVEEGIVDGAEPNADEEVLIFRLELVESAKLNVVVWGAVWETPNEDVRGGALVPKEELVAALLLKLTDGEPTRNPEVVDGAVDNDELELPRELEDEFNNELALAGVTYVGLMMDVGPE